MRCGKGVGSEAGGCRRWLKIDPVSTLGGQDSAAVDSRVRLWLRRVLVSRRTFVRTRRAAKMYQARGSTPLRPDGHHALRRARDGADSCRRAGTSRWSAWVVSRRSGR